MLKTLHHELIHPSLGCMPPYHPRKSSILMNSLLFFLKQCQRELIYVLEDITRVDNISWQMLKNPQVDNKNKNSVQKNPHVDDTKKKIVQKNSLVTAPRKRGQKVDYNLTNAPLRR